MKSVQVAQNGTALFFSGPYYYQVGTQQQLLQRQQFTWLWSV